ncbi:beta-lactamase family protein [Phytoactinopolyspora alkaliphila]|uniref:Beta-lactamase family protein n=1 Tax=Phytoactinopolyspora alkaliphila TaxID=1783498 RepID=A0A6N9YGN9_9ACTN|nr:serine hydrolase domain-containing protein [Phytoactinopolyspora alkaliphila]NED94078.1 beta-lactamase family protein [Phytoactinopolyspora alkaliphila]
MGTLQETLESGLKAETAGCDHPLYPGAVALLMHDGAVVEQATVGDAVLYTAGDDGLRPLPPGQRVPMRPDTVFDIASLNKLFTAVTTLALVDDGLVSLDAPVAPLAPEWAGDQRGQLTFRHLLTHTSGLPAVLRLWELPTQARRMASVFETPLRSMPGTAFEYSCVGYIVAGLLLERLTGTRLPRLVSETVLEPLGLNDTTYLPGSALLDRIAATEHQPYVGRGIVRGAVHDENNWFLGGTAGNAGLFSTAADLARFAEMLRRGGELDGQRILSAEAVGQMTSDQLPLSLDPGYRQGIGPRIGDRSFMGVLAEHRAFGHTGFTGTSLVITPRLKTVTILLTNRVHPSRDWSVISGIRQKVAALSAETAVPSRSG